jgi:hypothetical protein
VQADFSSATKAAASRPRSCATRLRLEEQCGDGGRRGCFRHGWSSPSTWRPTVATRPDRHRFSTCSDAVRLADRRQAALARSFRNSGRAALSHCRTSTGGNRLDPRSTPLSSTRVTASRFRSEIGRRPGHGSYFCRLSRTALGSTTSSSSGGSGVQPSSRLAVGSRCQPERNCRGGCGDRVFEPRGRLDVERNVCALSHGGTWR